MKLKNLGFDAWLAGQAPPTLQPGQVVARVVTVDRNAYLVRDEKGETPAELSGRFRFTIESSPDLPCVGDWVCIQDQSHGHAIIHSVMPRKSFLRRKSPGKTVEFQMIAANIDVAFIVQSCDYDFNLRRLERYLAACSDGGIEPVIILSKTDLVSPDDVAGQVLEIRGSGIGALVLPVSNATGNGLDQLGELMQAGRTYCLAGSSGVGKSTLINRLMGSDKLDTKAVSATGEGTHTTSRRQLLMLDNGAMLIDTPGMRELGLIGTGNRLDDSFTDIRELALACRFTDCTHSNEPGCAVLQAIKTNSLDDDRYRSYLKLKRETEYHYLSYAEKRKKDRAFGRHVKSVMNHRRNQND